ANAPTRSPSPTATSRSRAPSWPRAPARSRALLASGVDRGDRVAIWAPNAWPWIVAALGAHALGCVLVPINTRYKGEEAAHVLAPSGARVLVTVEGFLGARYVEMLRGAETAVPALDTIVIAPLGTATVPAGAIGWADFVARGAGVDAAEVARRSAQVAPHDVGDLMVPSGTTG